jgi:hypothetical protein
MIQARPFRFWPNLSRHFACLDSSACVSGRCYDSGSGSVMCGSTHCRRPRTWRWPGCCSGSSSASGRFRRAWLLVAFVRGVRCSCGVPCWRETKNDRRIYPARRRGAYWWPGMRLRLARGTAAPAIPLSPRAFFSAKARSTWPGTERATASPPRLHRHPTRSSCPLRVSIQGS